ncbi:MAG: CBS domain-containing protein [Desulfobacterales bacterium]|nr:CBS domain-containing protein [Desulfobacterales bacterium]
MKSPIIQADMAVLVEKRQTDDSAENLTVITTHLNADYDALGSMLAAHKLYPGSVVVFPGFHEKNSKNFFVNSMAYLFNMVDIRQIDLSKVKTLVVVDTKQSGRIGDLAALLENPDVRVHIYDHHPPLKNDIIPDMIVSRSTGANVTLLTEIIREKEIELTAEEATVMCLGIFEDTGSFVYPSTTESDFYAAGYLLSKGASLSTISNLISKEMDSIQVNLLNEMINAAEHHMVNGLDIVISIVACDEYIHDMAFLVQKMMKMENYNAVFAIASMKNKIYLAARSRTPLVDAGAIVEELGGGGHTFAAAATIKDRTLPQVEQQLIEILRRHVKAKQRAKDIMSSPPIIADHSVNCREAQKLLSRYNINALLVAEQINGKQKLLGFISRQVIEKALYHELDDILISEYMTVEFATVGPEADISEIQGKIIGNKQRVLPVIENEEVIGVITRTDLLNILVQESQDKAAQNADPMNTAMHPRTKNIIGFMRERLSERILDMLHHIGRVAHELGYAAYVVGGFVRDLFLYRHNEDIDIVIEGNGIDFAKEFAKRLNVRFNAHAKFGTAVIIFPDGFKIDVASARMEYYKSPAALPTVEMSSIKLDLFRRDFTINTLAIFLNPKKFGKLIDFFGGQRDIKEKSIRVLHNLSFVEDPTRVFRAIRFEQRFDFKIGRLTSGLVENAVRMDFFKQLSGKRIFSELSLILKEDNPTPALIRMHEYDLLKMIDPAIKYNQKLIAQFNSAKKVISWYDLLFTGEEYMKWAIYFMILIRHAGDENAREICSRFELAPRLQKMCTRDRGEAEACLGRLHRKAPYTNSELYRELKEFRTELILYMMSLTIFEKITKAISYYVTDLKHMRLSVGGKDLQAMGLSPSPVFTRILSAALDAKLNGQLETREDELEFLRAHVSEL